MAISVTRSAGVAHSSVCSRLIVLAIAAILGTSTLHLDLRSAAFNSGASVLSRPVTPIERKTFSRQALEGFDILEPALEPEVPDASTLNIDQNPQWATCFVQAQQASQSVLEEWVLRGERSSLSAFRAWRQDTMEPTAVRCIEMAEEEAMKTVCLECASPGGASPLGLRLADALPGVAFGSTSQCIAHTAMGLGFCKSGQVGMAH